MRKWKLFKKNLNDWLIENVLNISLIWYAVGITVCWILIFTSVQHWADVYYIWDKSKDVLLMLVILYLIPRHRILPTAFVFVYTILRLLWEIVSIIIQADINTHWGANILFLIMAVCLAIYLLIDIRKRWKQNS